MRDDIISGELAGTVFEEMVPKFDKTVPELATIVAGIEKSEEDNEEEEENKHEPVDVNHLKGVAGVPDFWAKSIEGHPMLAQVITDKDKPIIEHITKVKAEKVEEPSPMITIEIFFSQNEYFNNASLKFTTRE